MEASEWVKQFVELKELARQNGKTKMFDELHTLLVEGLITTPTAENMLLRIKREI